MSKSTGRKSTRNDETAYRVAERRPDLDDRCSDCVFEFGQLVTMKTFATILRVYHEGKLIRTEEVHWCPYHQREVQPGWKLVRPQFSDVPTLHFGELASIM